MLGFVLAGGLGALASAAPPATAPAASPYVGAAACGECHQARHRVWRSGRHSRMLQPATPESVLGDFARERLRLQGEPYTLHRRGDAFAITESYIAGQPRERRVR
jgi:hypothetical protein